MSEPIPMVMYCPAGHQHIDEGEWATKPHKTHQCQFMIHYEEHVDDFRDGRGRDICRCRPAYDEKCGLEWRPMNAPTVGVLVLDEKPAAQMAEP